MDGPATSLMLLAAGGTTESFTLDLLAVLATAAGSALLMRRLHLPAIPAYLIAGVAAGPSALALARSTANLDEISHLAIILLMFGIGLQLHLSVLRHGFVRMLVTGALACGLCIGLGWPVALAFGLPAPAALAVGMALSLSSTAVVLRILAERRELQRATGRLALAILVVQDLAVLGLLAALPTLARWAAGGGMSGEPVPAEATAGWARLISDEFLRVGGVGLLLVVGRWLLPPLMRESARGRTLEVMMITAVAVALGAALLARQLGFSLEMGAFLAGFLLARTPFRHQISGQIAPLRDLFIAVFFTTLGMHVSAAALLHTWQIVLLGTAALLVVKSLAIALSCWSTGSTLGVALGVGVFLAQGGEFSLVLLSAAHRQQIVGDAVLSTCVAVVVVSLVVTPALIQLGNRLTRWPLPGWLPPWQRRAVFALAAGPETPEDEAPPRRAIVAGLGPVGRQVRAQLQEMGARCTVIELNQATVQRESAAGRAAVYGDVANPDVLESAGVVEADALVITMVDEEAAARCAALARRLNPDLCIAARASVASHQAALAATGIDCVVVDELAAADAMVRALAKRIELHPPATASEDAEPDALPGSTS